MFIYAKDDESKINIINKLEDCSVYEKYIEPKFKDINEIYSDNDIIQDIERSRFIPDFISTNSITREIYKRLKVGRVALFTGYDLTLGKEKKPLDFLLNKYAGFVKTNKELFYQAQFQPNHPIDGHVYRKHPNKKLFPNLLVDIVTYAKYLKELKEHELLNILVNLGATKIELTEITENSADSSSNFEFGLQYYTAQAGMKVKQSTSGRKEKTEKHFMEGKDFPGKLDRNNYFWLNTEPSWETIITAREEGRASAFEIEITTSSSSSGSVEQNISIEYGNLNSQEKIEHAFGNLFNSRYKLFVEYKKMDL
ncbi:hypothetical protein KWH75_06530 [Morganella morganii]|uniref:hypothetical protein n=1 Tax=Morganella morganii TaxID=582 RepID=UPI0021D04B7E|nr:hypothetical protein [Morganella morganii]MCU6236723.1 hypothetical protein [Morganella morganii]